MLEGAKKRKWRGGPLGTPRALKRPESGWGATQAKRRRTEITRSLGDPGGCAEVRPHAFWGACPLEPPGALAVRWEGRFGIAAMRSEALVGA